jgi:hypothetical protein
MRRYEVAVRSNAPRDAIPLPASQPARSIAAADAVHPER